jgi:glycosyltransferase involved in cell wall biosynthesis
MNFKIVVPMYNVERWVTKTVTSILNQKYKNFECVFIDDSSSDKTAEIVGKLIKDDDRCSLVVNTERKLALCNIYNGFEFLNCEDEDVLLTCDGDDWLDGEHVLDILKESYETHDCWLTYGNYTSYPEGVYTPLRNFPTHIVENNLFRKFDWISSSLRTYKYKLWKNIKKEDLLDESGNFYEMAWDLAFMFPMLEMAGSKIHHLQRAVYIYNRDNPINDNKVNVQLQLDIERQIRSKEPYAPLTTMITQHDDRFVVQDPLDLLTASRFDVTSKTLYARHREKGVEHVWAKDVYQHLVDVWGGCCEIFPVKNGIEDFYNAYHDILDSIKTGGFDEEKSYIPVYQNRFLLNGSHRLAAAIQYNKPVVCKDSPLNAGQIECTSSYFQNRKNIVPSGLVEDVADAMALEYCRLKDNTYIATIYQHAFSNMDAVFNTFNKYDIGVVYLKDITLTNNFQMNYMLALYGDEEWMRGSKAHGFPGAISQASFNFSHGPSIKAFLIECDSADNVMEAKKEIRTLIGAGKGSMHTTDSKKETWRNACICFHNPTLKYMNECAVGSFHESKFKEFIAETKRIIEDCDVDIEDICVGGSAPLMAYGKRDCRDFDVLHLPSAETINFNENVSSHNDYLGYYGEPLEEIIFNPKKYFYIDGLKFISASGMAKMKSKRGEEKDYRDVELVGSIL